MKTNYLEKTSKHLFKLTEAEDVYHYRKLVPHKHEDKFTIYEFDSDFTLKSANTYNNSEMFETSSLGKIYVNQYFKHNKLFPSWYKVSAIKQNKYVREAIQVAIGSYHLSQGKKVEAVPQVSTTITPEKKEGILATFFNKAWRF